MRNGAGRNGAGSQQRTRRPAQDVQHTASPFESAVSELAGSAWRQIRTAFKGEVPENLRGSKITSQEAHRRVKSRLRGSLVVLSVLLVLVMVRVVSLQTFNRSG